MPFSKERASNDVNVRHEENRQPDQVKNPQPGFGDKKLEGPNRPST